MFKSNFEKLIFQGSTQFKKLQYVLKESFKTPISLYLRVSLSFAKWEPVHMKELKDAGFHLAPKYRHRIPLSESNWNFDVHFKKINFFLKTIHFFVVLTFIYFRWIRFSVLSCFWSKLHLYLGSRHLIMETIFSFKIHIFMFLYFHDF